MNKFNADCQKVLPLFIQELVHPNNNMITFKVKTEFITTLYDTVKSVDFLMPSHENIHPTAA